MSSSADVLADAYDGVSASSLARRLGVPAVYAYERVSSTLDAAHAIAATAASGTLVIADAQHAGRGRQGRSWTSAPGAGIWMTLIERTRDVAALDVLAVRCGLEASRALEPFATEPIRLKWPNDLYVDGGKLAGILIETRWRGTSPEWVAIGFGLNVLAPDVPYARGLRAGVKRLDALECLVPALRRAAAAEGHLTADECDAWVQRDLASGQVVTAPGSGTVQGISPAGDIRIREADGVIRTYRSGSLIFATPASCS